MTPEEAALLARERAILVRRSDIRTLALTGPDRVRFLNGQLTNDVSRLAPGEGCLAVKTSAKGRTEAYLRVRADEAALYLDLRACVADRVLEQLARYIIMDDCEVRDASGEVWSLVGPAPSVAIDAPMHGFRREGGLEWIRDATLGVEGWEIHGGRPSVEAPEAPEAALEILRVEEGVPVDGKELGLEVIPLEAHLEHAISTTKGCYSGQEVIARALNLGGVQWSLVSLALDVAAAPGAELLAEGKAVGSLSSVVYSPRASGHVGLGFVRRAHQAPGTALAIASGGRAVVVKPPAPGVRAQPE